MKIYNIQNKQVFYKHLNIEDWEFCKNFIFGIGTNDIESIWVNKQNKKQYCVVRWDGDWTNKYIVKDYK